MMSVRVAKEVDERMFEDSCPERMYAKNAGYVVVSRFGAMAEA